MGIEIERRFLVQKNDWQLLIKAEKYLQQGYISSDSGGWTTRVRIDSYKTAFLTLKYPLKNNINNEFEYLIPLDDAKSIWKLLAYKITKKRYLLSLKGGDWIVDCFENENAPLMIAEVEVGRNISNLAKPDWCDQEITGNYKLSNASLAKHPIRNWSKDEKQLINL